MRLLEAVILNKSVQGLSIDVVISLLSGFIKAEGEHDVTLGKGLLTIRVVGLHAEVKCPRGTA